LRGDPYYKLFAKGGIFQVASLRTATLAMLYGKNCVSVDGVGPEMFVASDPASRCCVANRDQSEDLDVLSVQKVLKQLGLAITLKVKPKIHFAAVLLTEKGGY
jgi:hypothetical protein